jgi:hypothetical protein
LPPIFSHGRKLRRTHIDQLIKWRRTFRTIAPERRRTHTRFVMIDRSINRRSIESQDEESPTTCTSVFRLLSLMGESFAIPTLIGSSNGVALFGLSHQGVDNAHGPIDRTRSMTWNGLTNDHCGNHDDEQRRRSRCHDHDQCYPWSKGIAGARLPDRLPERTGTCRSKYVVQQGRGTFGRRDTPGGRVEYKVRKIGRTGLSPALFASPVRHGAQRHRRRRRSAEEDGQTAHRHTYVQKVRTTCPSHYTQPSSRRAHTVRHNKRLLLNRLCWLCSHAHLLCHDRRAGLGFLFASTSSLSAWTERGRSMLLSCWAVVVLLGVGPRTGHNLQR